MGDWRGTPAELVAMLMSLQNPMREDEYEDDDPGDDADPCRMCQP